MDTYKISFLFNASLKSYGSLYSIAFSMKSIWHTFANFETAQAKLIEPIFQNFCKERYITFPNIIVTSLALAKKPAVQF